MTSRWSDLDRPPLSVARLSRALVAGGAWREVTVVEETASTNADVASAARAGAAPGLVLIAERQTAGRGRLDRTWEAPPRSAVLVSALVRPAVPIAVWPLMPLMTGVAVAEAVRGVSHLDAVLKWPNDVLVDGRKLAGVLVERVEDMAVIGVGLNVSLRVDELPVPTATSVALAGGVADRESLAKELLRALARRLDAWTAVGGAPEPVLAVYREICDTIGRDVEIALPEGGRMVGTAESVDAGGRLVVRDRGGESRTLSAGDVVHVRAAELG
jgi:BirA family biotin operon repressor/biotin-[acetyl-CoA-carboxylase] ligase